VGNCSVNYNGMIFGSWLSISVAWCLTVGTAEANGVDEFVRTQMEAGHVPGASVAVVKEGRVVFAKGYGMANLEHSVPATEHTVYQLASVTKQFTATAVMMLVEEGKLKLDQKVTDILEGLPQAWSNVTVRHLLNHTSGIKSYTGTPDFFKSARKDYKKEEIIELVANIPNEFAPGEQWNYNNTGYFLLGMVIEKVSGKDYGAFLSERIFQPLEMTTARLNDLTEIIPNRAQGYTRKNRKMLNGEYVSPTQPYSAGALAVTVLDLAKWDAALYTDKLLRRSTFEEMWSPTQLSDGESRDYGYGWEVDSYRTRKRLQHGGGIPGFSTFMARYVDDQLTVIALANSDGGAAERIANGVAAFYLPALVENAPKPLADGDSKTTDLLKGIIKQMAGGTGEPDWFTAEARKFFFPDRIKEAREMFGSHGELRSFELMEEKAEEQKKIRGYKAVFGKTELRVTFTLADDSKIAGIGVRPE
jgi:D-alanyl-D-alanine carboxypeptidase